jgi:hypothetical protein
MSSARRREVRSVSCKRPACALFDFTCPGQAGAVLGRAASPHRAAQTRLVSGGPIWPSRGELSPHLKYMADARILEFESSQPSQPVRSPRLTYECRSTTWEWALSGSAGRSGKRNPCGLQFLIRRTAHDFLCVSSCLHFPRSGAGTFVNAVEHADVDLSAGLAEMVALVLRRKNGPYEWAAIGRASHHHTGENRGGGHVE